MQINWYWNRFCYFWVCSREDQDHWIAIFVIYFDGILQMEIPSAVFPAIKIVEIFELLFQSKKARDCTFSLKILFLGVTEFASCMSLSVAHMLPVCYVRGWRLLFQRARRQLMIESAMKNFPFNTACIIPLFCQINDHWLHNVERSDMDRWIWWAGNIQKICLKFNNY